MRWQEVVDLALQDMASQYQAEGKRTRALSWQGLNLSRRESGTYPKDALAQTYDERLELLQAQCPDWPHPHVLEEIARYGWWTIRANAFEPCDGMRMHGDRVTSLPLSRFDRCAKAHVLHHRSLAQRAISVMLRPGMFLQAVDCRAVGGEVLWVVVTQWRQSMLEGVLPSDEVILLGETYEQALLGLLSGYVSWCIHQQEYRLDEALTPPRQQWVLRYERTIDDLLGKRWVRCAEFLYDHRCEDPYFGLTESDRAVFVITPRQTEGGMGQCDLLGRPEWYDVPYVFYSRRHRDHINAVLDAQVPDDGDYDDTFLYEGGRLGNSLFWDADVQALLLVDDEVNWFMYYFPLACHSHVVEVLSKTALKVFVPESGQALRRMRLSSMAHNQGRLGQRFRDILMSSN